MVKIPKNIFYSSLFSIFITLLSGFRIMSADTGCCDLPSIGGWPFYYILRSGFPALEFPNPTRFILINFIVDLIFWFIICISVLFVIRQIKKYRLKTGTS